MEVGELDRSQPHWTYRCLDGGVLMQEADVLPDPEELWQVVTEAKPTDAADGRSALRLGDGAARQVQRHRALQGPHVAGRGGGPDEPRRFGRDRHRRRRATGPNGSVLGSDAFFPFPDSIEAAAAAGVAAVIQPGGSKNDDDVDRRLQPPRHAHDLHRPATFQALEIGD